MKFINPQVEGFKPTFNQWGSGKGFIGGVNELIIGFAEVPSTFQPSSRCCLSWGESQSRRSKDLTQFQFYDAANAALCSFLGSVTRSYGVVLEKLSLRAVLQDIFQDFAGFAARLASETFI